MAASSDGVPDPRSPRAWLWGGAVAGTFTLTAGSLSIELARYGFGDRSGLAAPFVFWGVLGAGVLVTTVVFAPIGPLARIACAGGGLLGGTLCGVVYWTVDGGGVDLWYFTLIAGLISGWLIGVYLAWMLLVGALLKASGARGFPELARRVAALAALIGAMAVGGVAVAGEQGSFVCPPWPLERSQVPKDYCAELVDRRLVGSTEAFVLGCRHVRDAALGSEVGGEPPYTRDRIVESRSIEGVSPSTAVAMRITWPGRPEGTERRWAECGEWNLAPSALLSREEVRALVSAITSGSQIAD